MCCGPAVSGMGGRVVSAAPGGRAGLMGSIWRVRTPSPVCSMRYVYRRGDIKSSIPARPEPTEHYKSGSPRTAKSYWRGSRALPPRRSAPCCGARRLEMEAPCHPAPAAALVFSLSRCARRLP